MSLFDEQQRRCVERYLHLGVRPCPVCGETTLGVHDTYMWNVSGECRVSVVCYNADTDKHPAFYELETTTLSRIDAGDCGIPDPR